MTIIDVHPDDLLEREIAGTLSAADEQRLAVHIAHCKSCRLERQLRADFDRELGSQSAPVMLQALVSDALRAARPPDPFGEPGTENRQVLPVPVRRSGRRIAVLLASGVALSAGLAAARPDLAARALDYVGEQVAGMLGVGSADSEAPATRGPASPSERAALGPTAADAPRERASVAPADRSELARPAAPSSDAERGSTSVSRAVATSPNLPDPSAPSARRSQTRRSSRMGAGVSPPPPRTAPADEPAQAAPEPAQAAPEPARGNAPATSAAILFDHANAARRRGPGAEGLYQELQTRFPDSAEARLSFAIVARMRLDAGDAEGALASFETYLSTGDRALREQAMAGRALAWGRLGESDRERQSWLALLGAYPRSSYAELARRRLAQDRR